MRSIRPGSVNASNHTVRFQTSGLQPPCAVLELGRFFIQMYAPEAITGAQACSSKTPAHVYHNCLWDRARPAWTGEAAEPAA